MIKLIVGLGNPGAQYEKTRHNAGFLFLDALAQARSCSWSNKAEFQGLMTECALSGQKILMLKPQTYMNRSGQSVGKVARYYKIMPQEILVVHDELDFPAGVIKIKKDGGLAGNNGLKDIAAHLNTRDFYRLRIGIGRPQAEANVSDYVLSTPSAQDRQLIASAIERGLAEIDPILIGDINLAINKLNAG